MLLLLSLALLVSRLPRVAGTTLLAPLRWTCLSALALGGIQVLVACAAWGPSTVQALQYGAGTLSLCPLMALLGAKRPQNVAWQWIVASLWVVMVLPVGEMLVLWRGGVLDEGPMRQWLILLLLLIGLSNYLVTRFGWAASIATAGQSLVLMPHIPFLQHSVPTWHFTVGNRLIALAISVAWLQTIRNDRVGAHWDRVWKDFRDAYGIVWGLRVMERVNSGCRKANLSTELTWYGFAGPSQQQPDETETQELLRTLKPLLCRFVSQAWIDARSTETTDVTV